MYFIIISIIIIFKFLSSNIKIQLLITKYLYLINESNAIEIYLKNSICIKRSYFKYLDIIQNY